MLGYLLSKLFIFEDAGCHHEVYVFFFQRTRGVLQFAGPVIDFILGLLYRNLDDCLEMLPVLFCCWSPVRKMEKVLAGPVLQFQLVQVCAELSGWKMLPEKLACRISPGRDKGQL